MKQETLEEAAERLYPTPQAYELYKDIGNSMKREAFISGAKWQEEQFKNESKDKLFTVEQMNEVIAEVWNSCIDNEGDTFTQVHKRIIQSLLL